MNKKELVVVACPPFHDFPEAPRDQSESTKVDCPKCNEKMWLSKKKKALLLFNSCLNRDIFLACYHCITTFANENPDFFKKADMFNI